MKTEYSFDCKRNALERNKTFLRLWISKQEIKLIAGWITWFLMPLFLPLAWHPCLYWVCFSWNTLFLLKAGFLWDATSKVLLAKNQRQNWIEKLFLKMARDFRVFDVLWHVLYSYLIEMKCYFLKSQMSQAVFQVNDFHREIYFKYYLNI